MEGNAYVFYHPQYGGLRVVRNDEGLFFCIEDSVAITDIGRDKLFTVLADTVGKVVEMCVEELNKKVPKDIKPRLFFGEFFSNADKVKRNCKLAWRSMILKEVYCNPLGKPMDIRYATDGLYINGMRIN